MFWGLCVIFSWEESEGCCSCCVCTKSRKALTAVIDTGWLVVAVFSLWECQRTELALSLCCLDCFSWVDLAVKRQVTQWNSSCPVQLPPLCCFLSFLGSKALEEEESTFSSPLMFWLQQEQKRKECVGEKKPKKGLVFEISSDDGFQICAESIEGEKGHFGFC